MGSMTNWGANPMISDQEAMFLKNLAYCAAIKHRNPGDSPFLNPPVTTSMHGRKASKPSDGGVIRQWVTEIVRIPDPKRLIYYFVVDHATRECLKDVFAKLTWREFSGYFDVCAEDVRMKCGLSNGWHFRYMNMFHLVGTLRIIKDYAKNAAEIVDRLSEFAEDISAYGECFMLRFSIRQVLLMLLEHVLADYSAQLFTDANRGTRLLKTVNVELLEKLQSVDTFTHILSLYSQYYYGFGAHGNLLHEFDSKVREETDPTQRSVRYHILLPQIHAVFSANNLRVDADRMASMYADAGVNDVNVEYIGEMLSRCN